jgi:hypothetical protein
VDEQENIDYFQAVQPTSPGAKKYSDIIKLHNDDALNKKFFQLSYTSNLPPGWGLDINGGNLGVALNANEIRDIPITITPGGPGPDPAPGTTYAVEVLAQFQRDMINTTDPTLPAVQKKHFEFKPLGGVRVEAKVMLPTKISCTAERWTSVTGAPEVTVKGILIGLNQYDAKNPPRVMIEGTAAKPAFLTNSLRVLRVDSKGQFIGVLGRDQVQPTGVICLFGGTDTLASAGATAPITNAPPPTGGSTTPGGGGGLIVPGKFSIHFPPGAFNGPLNLTYTPIFSPTHALPDGDAWLGFFKLEATDNNQQPVTQFDKPYTMVISYSNDLLRQFGVVDGNLNVVFWDGNAWKPMLPCAGCGVDATNHRVTIVANHFTEFALIGTGSRREIYLPLTLR